MQDVFSLRKPKDIKAGLSSGGKSIVKGIGAGVVGLVAAPVLGAHQEGFLGFAKGTAAGRDSLPSCLTQQRLSLAAVLCQCLFLGLNILQSCFAQDLLWACQEGFSGFAKGTAAGQPSQHVWTE